MFLSRCIMSQQRSEVFFSIRREFPICTYWGRRTCPYTGIGMYSLTSTTSSLFCSMVLFSVVIFLQFYQQEFTLTVSLFLSLLCLLHSWFNLKVIWNVLVIVYIILERVYVAWMYCILLYIFWLWDCVIRVLVWCLKW